MHRALAHWMWQQVKFVVGVILELTQILNWGKEPKKTKGMELIIEQGQDQFLNLDQTNRFVLFFLKN